MRVLNGMKYLISKVSLLQHIKNKERLTMIFPPEIFTCPRYIFPRVQFFENLARIAVCRPTSSVEQPDSLNSFNSFRDRNVHRGDDRLTNCNGVTDLV